jgi:predicted alpha/beta hydrolase
MGLGEDVPVAALREWSGWTKLPGYFYDDPSFDARTRAEATTVPILAVGVDDDPWSAPAAIDALLAAAGGPVERRQYSPADLGQEHVGHHGLFRRAAGARFWPELLEWLTPES